LVEKPKGRDNFEDLDLDRMIILKMMLKTLGVGVRTGFKWLKIVSSGGFL
jgi:hypothetical protein